MEPKKPTPDTVIAVQKFLDDVDAKNSNASSCVFSEYAMQFLKIRLESDDFREQKDFTCDAGGGSLENLTKNRYRDVLPYDFNRVKLRPFGSQSSDYINASYINGSNGHCAYIATQGPLDNTVEAFWSMVMQCHVKTIVMLCELVEDGKPKCSKYWPALKEKKSFGNFKVSLVEENRLNMHYTVRRMVVRQENEKREVKQFHFHQWPDHSTPEEIEPLLDFLRLVREHQADSCAEPIVIHCSAGCGRTGTFCALDMARSLFLKSEMSADFSVYGLVCQLRKQRPAMVQTREQYILLHQSIYILFKHFLDELGLSKKSKAVTKSSGQGSDEMLVKEEKLSADGGSTSTSPQEEEKSAACQQGTSSGQQSFQSSVEGGQIRAEVSSASRSDDSVPNYCGAAISMTDQIVNV